MSLFVSDTAEEPVMPGSSAPIRILAIDGGGVRGLLPALILKELDRRIIAAAEATSRRAKPLSEYFDLIAGTSSGGLLAIGLACHEPGERTGNLVTTDDIISFYTHRSAAVFPHHPLRRLRQMWRVAYDHGPYERERQEILGERRLSEVAIPLLLPAYDVRTRTAKHFRSHRAVDDPAEDYKLRLVARAITAAPTYYAPVAIQPISRTRKEVLIDGGIFANTPSLCALTVALRMFGRQRDVLLISVGTGQANLPLPLDKMSRWGALQWFNPRRNMPLVDAMMDGQADAVDHLIAELLEPDKGYFRFDPVLPPHLTAIDNSSAQFVEQLHSVAAEFIEGNSDRLAEIAARLLD